MDEFERIQNEVRESLLRDAADAQPIDHNANAGYEQMITDLMEKLGGAHLLQRDAEQSAAKLARTLDNFRAVTLEIAANLSYAGSCDHKTKNEAILKAIARLLALTLNYTARVEMDDIPF